MNKEAILEVANLIEQSNPKSFHMGAWFGELTKVEDMDNASWKEQLVEESGFDFEDVVVMPIAYHIINGKDIMDKDFQNQLACNTTACIAGWTVFNEFIKNGTDFGSNVESRASELLGLNYDQSHSLFFCGYGTLWDRIADKYEFQYDRDEPATWNFPNIMVADVLRKIVSGEFELGMSYFEDDSEDEYENSY